MISNLDPKRFQGALRFVWFASGEGRDLDEALEIFSRRQALEARRASDLKAAVKSTVARVGSSKFERHFEIKRIVSFGEIRLFELRWRISESPPLLLRLYFTLDADKSLVVGLCFREKLLLESVANTRFSQQRDMESAADLARVYWKNNESGVERGSANE